MYQLVFQNRVSEAELKVIDTPQGELWVQPRDHLIRPYGICVRRVPASLHKPLTTASRSAQALPNTVPSRTGRNASSVISSAQRTDRNPTVSPRIDLSNIDCVTVDRSVRFPSLPDRTESVPASISRHVAPPLNNRALCPAKYCYRLQALLHIYIHLAIIPCWTIFPKPYYLVLVIRTCIELCIG